MNTKILIISNGPSQLLHLVAVLRQTGQLNDVLGVVSYISENPLIVAFEKQVCGLFNFRYLGSIADFRKKIIELTFSSWRRFGRVLFGRDLILNLRDWLEVRLEQQVSGLRVLLSYRENLVTDRALLDVLQPVEILMVPDGFNMVKGRNVVNRLFFSLMGVHGKYGTGKVFLYEPDYFPKKQNSSKFKTETLNRVNLEFVCRQVRPDSQCFKFERELGFQRPITLLLWQNLFPKFVSDYKLLMSFYEKILFSESQKNDNILVVKPHPRNTKEEVNDLEEFCPYVLRSRVKVITEPKLLPLPFEVLVGGVDFVRVIGMASTGIWALASQFQVEVGLYSDRGFPNSLQREIKRFADTLDTEIFLQ